MADQRKESAVAFLEAAVAYFAKLGIRIDRVRRALLRLAGLVECRWLGDAFDRCDDWMIECSGKYRANASANWASL